MIKTQDFNALLHRPALRKLTDIALNEYPAMYPSMFYVKPADSAFVEEALWAGTGNIPQALSDTDKTATLDSFISPPFRVRMISFRGAYEYTWEAAQDDRFGFFSKSAASLGASMRETQELVAIDVINSAATSGRIGGWDRLTLANAAHKLPGTAATFSNILPAMGPSPAALDEVRTYFRRMPDNRGRTKWVRNITLWVPEEDVPAWDQLIRSNTDITQPNPNVINPFTNFTVVGHPHLVGFNFVAQGDGPSEDSLLWYNRFGPLTDTWDQADPRAIVHRIWWKGRANWLDARRLLFSPRA